MLDIEALRRVKLLPVPYGQLVIKQLMRVDYRFPRRTDIVIEGEEQLPDHPVFLAMNHTDRYNYWPLQYELQCRGLGFTATWVKGKYYENKWLGRFLSAMNNIPVPSRGYLLTTDFRTRTGRVPTSEEYRMVRDLVDGSTSPGALSSQASETVLSVVGRDELTQARFVAEFVARFDAISQEVVRLNRLAIEELGLHVLIFPEGTRGKQMRPGHVGLAQMTQHLGATIVPVGCSGSDDLYPGNSPFSKGGTVTYRIGAPLTPDDPAIRDHRVPSSILPFTAAARAHDPQYRAITDVVMARIAELVDAEYRPSETSSEGTGSRRFV